jgi:hypothetical protein
VRYSEVTELGRVQDIYYILSHNGLVCGMRNYDGSEALPPTG